ncbi:MAG: hypothetical protein JWN15_3480 [Firmicutes bacterium]|nr:hypothetical protein [Bacillota bacterium]
MSDQNTDRNYAKIESLLRLAENPGATQEERDNAMEKAAAIAAKYQIDASKLDPNSGQYTQEEIVTHVFEVPTLYGLNFTRSQGLYLVMEAMGARAYLQHVHTKTQNRQVVIYATESTMEVLKVLVPSLVLQEANTNAAYLRKLKQDDPWFRETQSAIMEFRDFGDTAKKYTKLLNAAIRTHRKSFCLAFFVEAAKTVREKRADAVQSAGGGYALVVVDTAARLDQAMADIDLKNHKVRKAKWSAGAWDKGSAAGAASMVGQTEVHGGRTALTG